MPIYYHSVLQYALCVCVGCTDQMVATASIFKPFLGNISDIDTVANFGKHIMEEAEVITISCHSQLPLYKLIVSGTPNQIKHDT